VLENEARLSRSFTSKSIENLDCEFSVAVNALSIVRFWLVALNAVTYFGFSPVPGPVVMRSFAPLYASVTDEKI
jgi:hypothetical protein